MSDTPITRRVLPVCFALVVTVVVLGNAVGQPAGLAYVTSESMEPTLNPGEGFVVLPAAVAGAPTVGDVVIYESETLSGGGLTTHRIVEETPGGYVTKGDANAFTDQAGGEPPVTSRRIRAVAVLVDGHPLAVPGVQRAATTVRAGLAVDRDRIADLLGLRAPLGPGPVGVLLLGAGAFLLRRGAVAEGRERSRRRSPEGRHSLRAVVVVLAALVVVPATAAMVLPGGAYGFDRVAVQNPSTDPRLVEVGGSTAVDYRVPNGGPVPVAVFLDPSGPGVDVRPRQVVLPGGGEVTATVTLAAPTGTGRFSRSLVEHRYLAVLPLPVLRELHRVHPLVALVAVDGLLGCAVAVTARLVLGAGRVRTRRRRRGRPVGRLRTLLRGRNGR